MSSALISIDKASALGPGIADAVKKLRQGNQRFADSCSLHPHVTQSRRAETSRDGQHPYAAVLTCSDSRVPVELVFDAGVGDIFAVRIPGNVCMDNAVGAMEYAVDHLHVPIVLVLGHTQCGAIAGHLAGAHGDSPLARLLAAVEPAAKIAREQMPGANRDALMDAVTRANVHVAAHTLVTQSGVLKSAVAAGRVALLGGIYNVSNGEIEWL